MRPLNQDTIPRLRSILDKATQPCPPYIVDYGETVIVTNQSILLEWPSELVDRECSQYKKLEANGEDKLAGVRSRFEAADWREVLLDPAGKFEKVEEWEPDDDEVGHDALVFVRKRVQRMYYHWTNFELVEFFVTDPVYRLYRQPPEQNIAEIMRMMAVFQRDVGPIGIFANQKPEG